jgi:uncharacterized membrane protein
MPGAEGLVVSDRAIDRGSEDRVLPAIVYGLFLLGAANGLTTVAGLVLALANRGRAGERMRTHYTFLIRTCWLWLAWMVIGIVLIAVGAPLSLVLVGIPFFLIGWAIIGLIEIWFIARVVIGAIYLAQNEAYPRPYSWLI